MKLERAAQRPSRLSDHLGFCGQLVGAVAGIAVVLALASEVPRWMEDHAGISHAEIARSVARKIAFEAYPRWQLHHAPQTCPARLADLAPYGDWGDLRDPWGTEYAMYCGARGIVVQSLGQDRTANTLDDIWSRP